MEQELVNVKLNPEEWKLVAGLRDIPSSPLRDLMQEMMVALVDYVREPRCAEIQADGVPCETPAADCEQCLRVKELLFTLRRGIAKA
ncbi:MAG: hypothetical protein MUO25_06515 [Thermoanaerobaculaceae bacterium]|jgi:hypothetical protein|nr:hypothetical protein [Thermoanaerobaculaceae bacterium]